MKRLRYWLAFPLYCIAFPLILVAAFFWDLGLRVERRVFP